MTHKTAEILDRNKSVHSHAGLQRIFDTCLAYIYTLPWYLCQPIYSVSLFTLLCRPIYSVSLFTLSDMTLAHRNIDLHLERRPW